MKENVREIKVAILIGNGFDLGMKLPTSWLDFKKWLKNHPDKLQEDLFVSFLDEYDLTRKGLQPTLWSDVENAIPLFWESLDEEQKLECGYSIDDFTDTFDEYLRTEVNGSIKINEQKSNQFIEGLKEILNKIDMPNELKEHVEFSFINFNYTDTLDQLITLSTEEASATERVFKVPENWNIKNMGSSESTASIHVHGSIHNINASVVIGVDNDAQLESKSVFYDEDEDIITTRLVKNKYIEDRGRLLDDYEKGKNVIETADVVVIYGLSLGESDHSWAQRIFNNMRVSKVMKNSTINNPGKVFYFNYSKSKSLKRDSTRDIKAEFEIRKRLSLTKDQKQWVNIIHDGQIWQFK